MRRNLEFFADQQFYLDMSTDQFPQPIVYQNYLNAEDILNHICYHSEAKPQN